MLVIDEPLEDPNSSFKQFLWHLDIFFTILFTIESALKIIALGFIWNPDFDKKQYNKTQDPVQDWINKAQEVDDN